MIPVLAQSVPVLGPIVDVLRSVLMGMTDILHNYGFAVIIFTICVRGLLSPLNLRQLRSARKMASLGPKIKQLQQKYKGDRQGMSQAQMALYKEEGVNPAAGCLPLLLQMPILYSMFFVFKALANDSLKNGTVYPHIYHQAFLWFTLDKPDGLFGPFFLGHDAFWGPLPILAAATQWIQQRMMLQPTSDPQQRSTQMILQFMPLLIMFFAVNYPAGLALYWVTSTTFSIVMQYFITGWGQLFTNPLHIPEATPALASGGSAGGISGTGSGRTGGSGGPGVRPRPGGNGAGRNTVIRQPQNGTGRNGVVAADEPEWTPRKRTGRNGNGAGAVSGTMDGDDGPSPDGENDLTQDGARLGKMQRAALRSPTTTRPRSRPVKGVKR